MLQFDFIMIYIIHITSVLLEITKILKFFLRSIIHFFLKIYLFSQHIMKKSSRLEEDKNIEEKIIKAVRNQLRLEKEISDLAIKVISNLFKENKAIEDRIFRDIRNLFEHEDYYKPVRVGNFWSNNYIEYKVKRDRKTLSVEEYLNKIRSYLKDIINNLKKSDTWKIQLTITIDFISSKDDNDEEHVMHSKSDKIKIIINDKAEKGLEELFKSLTKNYQIGLEKSMRGSDFTFDCVHLLYYKYHKINPNYGGSYIGSPDWIKNNRSTKDKKRLTKNNKN